MIQKNIENFNKKKKINIIKKKFKKSYTITIYKNT